MGLLKELNSWSNRNKERKAKREQKKKEVNKNPTEEELKNNKKGKLAYLWTFISIIVYLGGFLLVASAWMENIAVGIVALIFVLSISPIAHNKAIHLAKEQRKINGKGLFALILATILPTLILICGFLFFVFGGIYNYI